MIAFTARGVAASELPHLNTRVVVLAEDPDGDGGPCLELSRALTDSRQDRELGMDTYSLSTQTGATVYGGVSSYVFDGTTLTMRLDRQASETLGVPSEFSIVLDADPDKVRSVRLALCDIIGEESAAS